MKQEIVKVGLNEEQKKMLELLVEKRYEGVATISELLRLVLRNFLDSEKVKKFLER